MTSSLRNDDYPQSQYDGLTFVQTSSACPEQYDIFLGGLQVGWAHLRNGYFQVTDAYQGRTFLTAQPEGDGAFEWSERDTYLDQAAEAINAQLDKDFSDEESDEDE